MGSHAVGCGPGWGGTLLSVPTPSGFSSHPLKFQTPLSLARQAGTGPLWAGGGGHRLGGFSWDFWHRPPLLLSPTTFLVPSVRWTAGADLVGGN